MEKDLSLRLNARKEGRLYIYVFLCACVDTENRHINAHKNQVRVRLAEICEYVLETFAISVLFHWPEFQQDEKSNSTC